MTRRDLLKLAAAASFLPADDSPTSGLLHEDADGRLVYQTDELGNRIPDFSMCGYKASAGLPGVRVSAMPLVPSQLCRMELRRAAYLPEAADG